MDPKQSNDGENSQGHFPGGNSGATVVPTTWNNTYMYGYQQPPCYVYQQPPGFVPQGFQPRPPNFPNMNPSAYAPEDVHQAQGFRQAEVSETFVHHAGANVAGGSASASKSKKRNKTGVTRTKLSNFNPAEDKNLVKSWLEISCDPITNTGQKFVGMWDRIVQRYNSRRESNPERTVKSLQSRWDFIRAECTVFAGFYADSIRENASGMSDADKTTHAAADYADVKQKQFCLLHCWDLLKDAPKWQDPVTRVNSAAARGEGFGEDSHIVDLQGGQTSPVRSGAPARRPMGRDAAKAAKKKANSDAGSSSSAEYAAKMQELSLQKISVMQDRYQRLASIDEQRLDELRRTNEAMIQIEQDKLRLAREQHEAEKRREEQKEDERVLKIDLDECPPKLRAYYELMQEEILDRARSRRRQGH